MIFSLSLSLSPLLIEMAVGVFAVTLIDFFFFSKYLCATNVCYVQKEDYSNVVFLEALASSFCLSPVFSLSMGWNDLSHFFTSVGLLVSLYKDLNSLIFLSFDYILLLIKDTLILLENNKILPWLSIVSCLNFYLSLHILKFEDVPYYSKL